MGSLPAGLRHVDRRTAAEALLAGGVLGNSSKSSSSNLPMDPLSGHYSLSHHPSSSSSGHMLGGGEIGGGGGSLMDLDGRNFAFSSPEFGSRLAPFAHRALLHLRAGRGGKWGREKR